MIWEIDNNLETNIENSSIEALPNIIKHIRKIIYILFGLHFLFNFLILPGLNILYLVEVILILWHLIMRGWRESALLIIGFLFLEGQGRIIWSYNPFFRLIFDITLILAFFRKAIRDKKIFPIDLLPNYLLLLIILHFFWYGVQLFNTDNVGVIGVLAAAKIYIIPFFIFFLFIMEPINHRDRLRRIQLMVLCMLFGESLLSIFQMIGKEQVLLQLHPYYTHPLHGDQFSGAQFRPFGTSFVAGGHSVLFYLTVGMLFIIKDRPWINLFRGIVVILSLITLFISQVRSAMLKFFLIFLAAQLVIWIAGHKRFKTSVKYMMWILLIFVTFIPMVSILDIQALNLERSYDRLLSLTDVNTLKTSRLSFDRFFQIIDKKLDENPMGLGPGRTGAASSISNTFIMNDPVYGKASGWANDNLFVSLIIDLGWGAIFYILIIFIFPFKLLFYGILHWRTLPAESFRIIMISAISTLFILAGNWGAISLPYNPESFMFWLWVSLGWSEYSRGRKYDY